MIESFDKPVKWLPCFAAIFYRPASISFAAFDGKHPVGGGHLHFQDKQAWLVADCVFSESQGQHAHRVNILLDVKLAIEAGADLIRTETGETIGDELHPILHNIFTHGSTQAYFLINYQFGP